MDYDLTSLGILPVSLMMIFSLAMVGLSEILLMAPRWVYLGMVSFFLDVPLGTFPLL